MCENEAVYFVEQRVYWNRKSEKYGKRGVIKSIHFLPTNLITKLPHSWRDKEFGHHPAVAVVKFGPILRVVRLTDLRTTRTTRAERVKPPLYQLPSTPPAIPVRLTNKEREEERRLLELQRLKEEL